MIPEEDSVQKEEVQKEKEEVQKEEVTLQSLHGTATSSLFTSEDLIRLWRENEWPE